MHLSQLLSGINCTVIGNADLDIEDLTCDSRQATKNSLFIAINGFRVNGADYCREAIEKGAVAILTEKPLETANVTQILVNNVRLSMSETAKNFNYSACDALKIIFVTGTNGKTSVTYMLDSIFRTAGYKTTVIGSNGIVIDGEKFDNNLTTPDPIQLHKAFRLCKNRGVKYVFLEATAHAIALGKLQGIRAETAVFTNLSQDHLDFFKTMEAYAEKKKSLFVRNFAKTAVVNADDETGREILKETKLPTVSYGYVQPSDVFALDVAQTQQGIRYTVNLYDEIDKVCLPFHGIFNVYNTLAAATCARMFGIKLATVVEGLKKIGRIDGRNETFYRANGSKIVVDFAHTPDGIENILSCLSGMCKGKMFVVFGCGGDRDKFKRSLMGAVAAKYANKIFLTDDNPRTENPDEILRDVLCGIGQKVDCIVVRPRQEAIKQAVMSAGAGDTVAILGKGAERYQLINDTALPFCDVDYVNELLEE